MPIYGNAVICAVDGNNQVITAASYRNVFHADIRCQLNHIEPCTDTIAGITVLVINRVLTITSLEHIGIVAFISPKCVIAGTAGQPIITLSTVKRFRAGAPGQGVVTLFTIEPTTTGTAGENIITFFTINQVVSVTTV